MPLFKVVFIACPIVYCNVPAALVKLAPPLAITCGLNVWAYPNPVKPDYTGDITITGLAVNATVMILTSNGSLVHQGKCSSGIYKWDGRDLKGEKVASGIYMVATATENGEKGTVCKIAIIK